MNSRMSKLLKWSTVKVLTKKELIIGTGSFNPHNYVTEEGTLGQYAWYCRKSSPGQRIVSVTKNISRSGPPVWKYFTVLQT